MERTDYARWFRDWTPYISRHRDRTFVIYLEGEALDHGNLVNIVHDIALVHVLGARLVLVHGARPQLDAAIPGSRFHQGRRITRAADLPAVLAVLGQQRARLEALFSTGLPSSPLRETEISVVSGNFVTARPLGILDGIDHEFTGCTRRVSVRRLQTMLAQGNVILIPPVGYSPSGQVFNLAADELAADVALALSADKLIVFRARGPLTDASGNRISHLTPGELDQSRAPDDTLLTAVLRASRGGVPSCQLIAADADGALLEELYTAGGAGTQIREERDFIRPASSADVASIVEVIRPLEEAGVLVRRGRDRLEAEIDRFLVADIDGTVVGCCAVFPYDGAAELACVAVHPSYREGGPFAASAAGRPRVGAALLAAAEDRARKQGARRLFALTTQTRDWFLDHGFEDAGLDALPAPRQSLYNYQRNSRVMVKTL